MFSTKYTFCSYFFLSGVTSSNYSDSLRHRYSVDTTRDVTDSSDDERSNGNRNNLRVRRNIDEVKQKFDLPLLTFIACVRLDL